MIKRLTRRLVQYSSLLGTQPTKTTYCFQCNYNCRQTSSSKSNQETVNNITMNAPRLINEANNEERSRAFKICKEQLGGAWTRVNPDDITLIPITGGMSNSLYSCSLPESTTPNNGEPSQVLLRFYGYEARNSDLDIQLEIFNLLSLRDLGPKLYGKFSEGRIEEFLPANSLTCDELMNQDISLIIAKKLAVVHSLDVPIKKDSNWLGAKYRELYDFFKQQDSLPISDSSVRQSTKTIAQELSKIDFEAEINFVLDLCERIRSPLVFSHNDLHQGNILLAEYSKRRPTLHERIVFIDFEYCSYNYRGYDIANHFSEWCFEYDTPDFPHFTFYKERLPSKDQQSAFIRQYLEQQKQVETLNQQNSNASKKVVDGDANNNEVVSDINLLGERKLSVCGEDGELTNGHSHITNGHSGSFLNNTEVNSFLIEVEPFFMGANLLWTLWCIKSAYNSGIKFGYWEHAMARWELYSSFKTSYISEMRTQTNGNSSL